MYPSLSRVGYPVAKIRLFMSIIAAVFFGFLLYSASVNLKWFTIIRGFYLLLGIFEGLLIGGLEARIVIRKLIRDTETIVWQILPISAVSFGLPLLLAITFFGVSEFLPFVGYLVLSFVPVYYAISGWYFNKFEKQNKVRIFMFVYGVKYWREPIPDAGDRFYQFVRNVVSKNSSSIWSQMGYSKRLMATLEERQDIEPSTRKALSNILEAMNKYRRRMLTVFVVFVVSCPLLIVYLLVLVSTNTFGLVEIVNHRIVFGREISLVLGCAPFFSVFGGCFTAAWSLRKGFRKRISSMLARMDSDKLSSV
jgi:hypothetical protein